MGWRDGSLVNSACCFFDLSLVSRTHIGWLITACDFSTGLIQCFHRHLYVHAQTHTHTHKYHWKKSYRAKRILQISVKGALFVENPNTLMNIHICGMWVDHKNYLLIVGYLRFYLNWKICVILFFKLWYICLGPDNSQWGGEGFIGAWKDMEKSQSCKHLGPQPNDMPWLGQIWRPFRDFPSCYLLPSSPRQSCFPLLSCWHCCVPCLFLDISLVPPTTSLSSFFLSQTFTSFPFPEMLPSVPQSFHSRTST